MNIDILGAIEICRHLVNNKLKSNQIEVDAIQTLIDYVEQQENKTQTKHPEIFNAKSKEANIIKENPNPNFIPPATKQQESNELLSLNKLKQMDGEPVWLVDKEWNMSKQTLFAGETAKLLCFIDVEGNFCYRRINDYGQTYFTYLHKPEGEPI